MAIKFDLLTFSETWLTPNNVPPRFVGYTYSGLVRSSGRGGGIALYVIEQLKHEIIDELSHISPFIECLVVKVMNVIVVVVYRPPTGKQQEFFDYFDTLLQKLNSMCMPFLIIGDININMLGDSPSSKQLQSILNSYACTNTITKPSRISEKSSTLLDVTNLSNTKCISGLLSYDVRDHLPIFSLLSLSSKQNRF